MLNNTIMHTIQLYLIDVSRLNLRTQGSSRFQLRESLALCRLEIKCEPEGSENRVH